MLLLRGYDSKKQLKDSIGEPLSYSETSVFGVEYKADGVITGARRPHLLGGGREFFAQVTMKNGLIYKVS